LSRSKIYKLSQLAKRLGNGLRKTVRWAIFVDNGDVQKFGRRNSTLLNNTSHPRW
jgi:hypothetical protein